jgi:predicted DNA-binding transcriptional regulator AlpA
MLLRFGFGHPKQKDAEMPTKEKRSKAAQVAAAEKATKLRALGAKRVPSPPKQILLATTAQHQSDERGLPIRLLSKAEVCAITGLSFPTLWKWQRLGTFPRSRVVGGHSKWLSTDIDTWLANLTVRPLKGDAPVEAA